jgi:hypothetical protein
MITQQLKKLQGASQFNPIEYSSSGGVSTNYGSKDAYVNINTDFDESQFIRKSGDTVNGDLVFTGASKIVFLDGSEQRQAFDENNINAISDSRSKIQYIDASNNSTTISSDLIVTGALNINDNSLSYNKVSGLSSDISNLQSVSNNNASVITNHTTQLTNLEAYNTQNDTDKATIQTNLDSLNGFVNDINILDFSQETSINSINSHIVEIDTSLTNLQTDLTTNVTSQLAINSTQSLDILNNRNSLTSIQTNVTTLQTGLTTATTDITQLQTDFTTLS